MTARFRPRLFAGLVLLLLHPLARADWELAGAQYICSPAHDGFQVIPDDESSDDPPGMVHEKPGFKKLPEGASRLSCTLGPYRIKAQISVMSAGNGECEGSGLVRLDSISANGVELLPDSPALDWSCSAEQAVLTSVQINAEANGVRLTKCSAKQNDALERQPETCDSTSLDVNKISAENAAVDHNLVNSATQAAQSALKLPRGNDLATYQGGQSALPGAPLCAHWYEVFLDAVTAPQRQRHGRIAGSAGEKVYLHPTNPQLCGSPEDDGCKATAYVLPGDRVDVGLICGEWSFVQYESRLRTAPNTTGWLETARLYAVDPLPKPLPIEGTPTEASNNLSDSNSAPDVLTKAVEAGKIDEVKRLISADTTFNAEREGGALLAAIRRDNAEMVKALLQLGFSANAHGDSSSCSEPLAAAVDSLASEEIFKLLVNHGADINCRSGDWEKDLLMVAASRNRLNEIEQIQNGSSTWPIHDPLVIADRLLAAGADPNIRDLDGSTALFDTLESNNIDIAKLLLQKGADPNISRADVKSADAASMALSMGSRPLTEAIHWYTLTKDPTMVRILLENGAKPDFKEPGVTMDEDGSRTYVDETPLSLAAESGYYTVAKLLLEHGADPDLHRGDDETPSDIASDSKHENVANLILGFSNQNAKKMPRH